MISKARFQTENWNKWFYLRLAASVCRISYWVFVCLFQQINFGFSLLLREQERGFRTIFSEITWRFWCRQQYERGARGYFRHKCGPILIRCPCCAGVLRNYYLEKKSTQLEGRMLRRNLKSDVVLKLDRKLCHWSMRLTRSFCFAKSSRFSFSERWLDSTVSPLENSP